MIIVEGPDGAGKSILIKTLARHLDLKVHTWTRRPTTCPGAEMSDINEEMIKMVSRAEPIIYDRCRAISEPIYGPICRKTDLLLGNEWNWMRQLGGLGWHFIFCRPSKDNIIQNCQLTKQPEWVNDNLGAIIDRYDKFMEDLFVVIPDADRVFRYDYYFHPPKLLVEWITKNSKLERRIRLANALREKLREPTR